MYDNQFDNELYELETAPVQTTSPDKIVVVFGIEGEVTITVAVFVHPFVFIYVTTTEPDVTPVTTPNDETVATDVFEDVHGVVKCAVAEPVRLVVAIGHKVNVPVIVGNVFTVTEVAEEVALQPLALVTATV